MNKHIFDKNVEAQAGQRELCALKQYFPQCFTADGAFDIEAFRAALPESLGLKETDETSGFTFLGKNYARLLTNMDTTTVIVPDEEHNAKPENVKSENVYISGDNLDALQHLVKSYAGEVKVIYIDPPYNTGNDGFVYKDHFTFTPEQLAQRLDTTVERAARILSMTRRDSASHAAWLTFMLPRLTFARDLLAKDGVIFISIDDNEQARLKVLCDEIFGEDNMIAQFCKKGNGGKQASTHFARIHEYVLCYAKNQFEAGEDEKEADDYPYTDASTGRHYRTQLLRKWGDAALRTDRPNMYFPLYYDGSSVSLEPSVLARPVYPMLNDTTEGRWRWGKDTMKDAIDMGLIELKEDKGRLVAYEKIFEPTDDEQPTKLFSTWLDNINNNTGKKLLKELFDGTSPFEYPKPLDLIKRIIKMGNALDCTVLDFFSGSATTAHAVMEMNAEDGDHRKFILVQWLEPCDEGSQAFKMGYKTIDEIGRKRIELAAEDIRRRYPDTTADLGFRHYTLAPTRQDTLDKMERFDPTATFGDGGTTLSDFGVGTVLRTWLVADGYGLTCEPEKLDLAGYTAYWMRDHLYLPGPDDDFTDESMRVLMDKYNGELFSPTHIVLFGYSFGTTARTMLEDNLRTLKDGTKCLEVERELRY